MNGNKNILANKWFAGGLIAAREDMKYMSTHRIANKIPDGFQAPLILDYRAKCTRLEDQKATPQCAAYSMTSLIESVAWKRTHIPIQLDPATLYREAKNIDMDTEEGTTFTSVFRASQNLGWIPQESKMYSVENFDEYCYAIHEFDFCLLGFDVTESWGETKYDGWVRVHGAYRGGHAVLGCHYNACNKNSTDYAGFYNSWGDWGAKGFGRILKDDFDASFLMGGAVYIPETHDGFLPPER